MYVALGMARNAMEVVFCFFYKKCIFQFHSTKIRFFVKQLVKLPFEI
jgi:hypothetical protein